MPCNTLRQDVQPANGAVYHSCHIFARDYIARNIFLMVLVPHGMTGTHLISKQPCFAISKPGVFRGRHLDAAEVVSGNHDIQSLCGLAKDV